MCVHTHTHTHNIQLSTSSWRAKTAHKPHNIDSGLRSTRKHFAQAKSFKWDLRKRIGAWIYKKGSISEGWVVFHMKTGGEGRFKEKVIWKSPVLWRAQNNIFFDLNKIHRFYSDLHTCTLLWVWLYQVLYDFITQVSTTTLKIMSGSITTRLLMWPFTNRDAFLHPHQPGYILHD